MEAIKSGNSKKPSNQGEEKSLKGTMVSVSFVAAIIVIMWVGVFWLYMSRI